jgi:hypothetical protein
MKRFYIYALVICYTILSISCKKNNNTATDPNNIPGLPPATQSGANTFGCLVNGVPWVPQGNDGTPNLSIDYDPGFNNGTFEIYAKNFLNASSATTLRISIIDSLNFVIAPKTTLVTKNSIAVLQYGKLNNCIITSRNSDTTITSSGNIKILIHDKQKRIIAGTFEGYLSKTGCDTLTISKGRFDFKF